jgi:site-specific recombinase XerD
MMRLSEIQTSEGRTRYVVLDNDGELLLPVARYLKHLDYRGYARNTLRSYGTCLQLFFEYIAQKRIDFHSLTVDDMASFVHWLKMPSGMLNVLPHQPVEQARSNRTINHILTVVSSFYDYLWRMDTLSTDLHGKIHTTVPAHARTYKRFLHQIAGEHPVEKHLLKQPEPKSRPRTLTTQQMEQLIAACQSERDQLLLLLLFESGMRIGECLALYLEDIDVVRYQLRVRDRGELANGAEIKTPSAERTLDVSAELIYRIMDYVASAHTETVTTNHLFIKQHGPRAGEPLSYADVHALFQRLKLKTGIAASAHLFRHTLLTRLAKAGWAPEHLRERAGHASFQHTYQLYVHPSAEDLREAWERTQEHICLSSPSSQEHC